MSGSVARFVSAAGYNFPRRAIDYQLRGVWSNIKFAKDYTVCGDRRLRRIHLSGPPSTMSTITLAMPPAPIALSKAIIESYDNLATLRTEDPQHHYLKLHFAPVVTEEREALLDSLQADFAIMKLS
jgi:hypothetical protein